jgi:hypothetical protein
LICGCAEETLTVPEGFIISTSGFEFTYVPGSQIGEFFDMTVFASFFSSLVNGRTVAPSISPSLSANNFYAHYLEPASAGACFTQYASLSLYCASRNVGNARIDGPRAVIDFGADQLCDAPSVVGSPGCGLSVKLLLPLFVLDFCTDPQPSGEIVFSTGSIFDTSKVFVSASVRCGAVVPNLATGLYAATSGTVTITPVFANPLP